MKTTRSFRLSDRPRGFTLSELMVGIATTSIILLGVMAAFIGVQNAVQANADSKVAVESNRVTLSYLERVVRMAGYGVDPRFAFDFSGSKNDFSSSTKPQFQTDDLAFRYRDPAFLRRGALSSSGLSLSLEGTGDLAKIGVKLPAGQPVMLACSGAQSWFMAKTTAEVEPTLGTISLAAYGTPFDATVPACLRSVSGDQAAFVFLVHELRVRIAPFGDNPYLIAYRGFADPTTTDPANLDFDPVASNIEFFKVEYVMNRPQLSSNCCSSQTPADGNGGNWIIGDDSGDAVQVPDPTATAPTYETPYDDASRYNAHPANIRQVRLTLGVRGDRQVKRTIVSNNWTAAQPVVEGETVSVLPPQYFRTSARTAIRVPNMLSRSFFVPALKDPSSAESLNVWGG